MINLILLLLLVHYAAILMFKPKSNVLGCGIFAWAGKKPSTFNRSKFDILGILNEVRGVDSCGVTIDGEIFAGVEKNKAYRDFISNTHRAEPKEIPSVIGHTRWSTGGLHDAYNAHPFGFGTSEDGEKYAFIGVHNGSLLNHRDLAKTRNIETSFKTKLNVHREKIDSEILLECIYTEGNFKVLSEYSGAAALVFYKVEEPNVIYCYHGKSKKWNIDKEASEERPLFYYKESKNSLYISSLAESLTAIGASEKTLGEFEHNVVYKITDGDISKAVKTKISRIGKLQKSNYGSTGMGSQQNVDNYNKRNIVHGYNYNAFDEDDNDFNNYPVNTDKEDADLPKKSNSRITRGDGSMLVVRNNVNDAEDNIYLESLKYSANFYKGRVVFNKLRYWKNGTRISGWYTYITGFGFYELGKTREEALNQFWYSCNKWFVDGEFVKDSATLTDLQWEKASIPFNNSAHNVISNPPLFPFYDGIRVKSELDLDACVRMAKDGRGFDAACLSMCSQHPIADVTFRERDKNDQGIYLNGELFSGSVAPIGSDRIYTIARGNLVKYRNSKDSSTPYDEEPNQVNTIVGVVDEIIQKREAEEEKADKEQEFKNNDLLNKEIDSVFMEPYAEFPQHKKRLQKFLPNPIAEKAINIITEFLQGTYQLIAIEDKE